MKKSKQPFLSQDIPFEALDELEEYPAVLTVRDVAEILYLHPNTVYRMIKTGQLPAARCGKALRVGRDTLKSYLSGEKNSQR